MISKSDLGTVLFSILLAIPNVLAHPQVESANLPPASPTPYNMSKYIPPLDGSTAHRNFTNSFWNGTTLGNGTDANVTLVDVAKALNRLGAGNGTDTEQNNINSGDTPSTVSGIGSGSAGAGGPLLRRRRGEDGRFTTTHSNLRRQLFSPGSGSGGPGSLIGGNNGTNITFTFSNGTTVNGTTLSNYTKEVSPEKDLPKPVPLGINNGDKYNPVDDTTPSDRASDPNSGSRGNTRLISSRPGNDSLSLNGTALNSTLNGNLTASVEGSLVLQTFNYINGYPQGIFTFSDPGSKVPGPASCDNFEQGIPASNNSRNYPVDTSLTYHCTPGTYSWKYKSWNSSTDFALTLRHAVRAYGSSGPSSPQDGGSLTYSKEIDVDFKVEEAYTGGLPGLPLKVRANVHPIIAGLGADEAERPMGKSGSVPVSGNGQRKRLVRRLR